MKNDDNFKYYFNIFPYETKLFYSFGGAKF